MADTVRGNITDAVWRGTIVSLYATGEDGHLFQIHGDWRPLKQFLEEVTLPCWVDYDPIENMIYPVEEVSPMET